MNRHDLGKNEGNLFKRAGELKRIRKSLKKDARGCRLELQIVRKALAKPCQIPLNVSSILFAPFQT